MCDPTQEKFFIAETIPTGLTFEACDPLPKIGESLINLIRIAKSTIDIASIYTAFLNVDTAQPVDSDLTGRLIYEELISAANRGVLIRFVLTVPSKSFPQPEIVEMVKKNPKNILVGYIDMGHLSTEENGIQHTKTFIFDKKSFYLGSANCDWRAYTEVVEIGMFGVNMVTAAQDLLKIYEMYWYTSYLKNSVPIPWPKSYDTIFNENHPMVIGKENIPLYFSSSPHIFVNTGRLNDAKALVNVINNTTSGIIRICAMEFSEIYFQEKAHFWGNIDYALRKASMERHVIVHIMVDSNELNKKRTKRALESLHMYNTIRVKTVCIPPREIPIPHARLYHAKLCLASDQAWLGTNNLTPSYFLKTAGIGCTICGSTPGGSSVIQTLIKFFDRYYNSSYATYLSFDA
ncbi:hypothetical protein HZS_3816 [Henneguya salminicola]|nr:hypothetical protein HZS_3816 [Henneguya salminicola]